MQNIEGIGCSLPNVLSRVLKVKDMSQRVIKSVVIPEGGLEYMIAKLLGRTYILKQLEQVGSQGGDGGGRRGEQGATTYRQATGSGQALQRPSCGGETDNC